MREFLVSGRLLLAVNHCYVPRPPLSAFIEFFWLYEGDQSTFKMERRLPDGAASLIINLRADPIRIYDRYAPERFEGYRGSVISGARSEFVLIDTDCQVETLGVQFRPGGTGPFLALPAADLHNEVISLDTLWGAAAGELREQLLEASTVERRFQVLERCLLACLMRPHHPARLAHPTGSESIHPVVARALKVFHDSSYSHNIRSVTEQLGMGQTRFIQTFRDAVGLTPKQYCRVRRFQETLHVLERGVPARSHARLALNCGYYDQAHFIHDFQAFAGLTPSAYLAQHVQHRNHVALPG